MTAAEPEEKRQAEKAAQDGQQSGRRRRRRRGRGQAKPAAPEAARPQPERQQGRPARKPPGMPRIGVGCVVLRGDTILLVRERGRWSLPKGGLEPGELLQAGARRETFEETGLEVEIRELAFVVEFQAQTWGHHLQFFYTCRETGGTLGPRDPDREVQEARFVPIRELREYVRFRPRLVSLEGWLRERTPKQFTFNLDAEPAMTRRRRALASPEQ